MRLKRRQVSGDVEADQRVEVYRNLHVKGPLAAWSVRDKETKRVVAIVTSACLRDVKLRVSDAGRQRVLRERRKNVHAWFEGTWEGEVVDRGASRADKSGWHEVVYNPYKNRSFVRKADEGVGVERAAGGKLTVEGRAFVWGFTPLVVFS